MVFSASLLLGVLVLTGVIAGAVLAAAVIERGGSRASAVLYACGWGLLVFIPVAWGIFGGQTAWYVQAVGAYDFAGAIPFHIGGGVAALAIAVFLPRVATHDVALRKRRGVQNTLGLVAVAVVWIGWLVLMEFGFNQFVISILVNGTILGSVGTVSSLLTQKVRTGRSTMIGAAVGLVSGLSGATAACVYLEPAAAAAAGVIAGVIASAVVFRRDAAVPSLAGFVAATGLAGGVTGLLMIGLLEPTRGFFYTGSLGLAVAQLTAVAVCVVYSALISVPLSLIAGGRLRKGLHQWAIPDSNR